MLQRFSIPCHFVLLVCFAAVMVLIWMLPLMLMGQVYDIYPLLLARNYALSGTFSLTDGLGRYLAPHLLAGSGLPATADGRLSAVFLAWLSPFIGWTNFLGWGFVAATIMAIALLAWWLTVLKLFHYRAAWISTAIIAFMPLYWRQAVWLNSYNFAILFLFFSFATFVHLRERNSTLAIIVSGLLFGLSVASKDAFLVFLPWYTVTYAWTYRGAWKKATSGIVLFLFCMGVVYLVPYVGDIRNFGYPVNHNLAVFWPGAEEVREGYYLHLYPDPYTYYFDREAYDAKLLAEYETFTPLQKLRQQKIFINFNVGKPGIAFSLLNGLWLFAGALPSLFHQETVGGVVLWLFILPGFYFCWKKKMYLAILLLGLVVSSELIMRFGLHYARDHLMDYGWVLALFAAVGVAGIADVCSQSWKKVGTRSIAAVILLFLCMQLLQANRGIFARRYSRTFVPQAMELAEAIDLLPDDAVVALGVGASRVEQLAQMSHRTVVPFGEGTLEQLLAKGMIGDAFEVYGVTHVYGYSKATLMEMNAAVPSVIALKDPEPRPVSVSPALNYLLHLIR